jgi:zinc protease
VKRLTYRRLRKGLRFLAAACLAVSAASGIHAQGAPKTGTTTVKPQKLNYKITTLSNGLKVVTLEDHRAPVVTLQVWYHVGSKDEPVGKAGFAHLFEHLMFKGSEHVGPQEHAKFVEQIGGDYNANTSFDRTLFYETVPSNALERILWLEADRMASLKVDEANLRSERDVVKEEHRLDVENRPYGTLLEEVQGMTFPASHPYAHTTIGIMADLDSAILSDVRAFHDEYYKPNDATLVLVGDFKTGDALGLIRKYFGPIPRAPGPFTRYPVPPDTQTSEKRATFYDKLAPLPAVGMAFRMPPPTDRDTPVFTVMSQILSQGQSSRLYRSLVRDKQLAVQASGGSLDLKLGGLFFFFALANAGKSPADLEKALAEQVDLLRAAPVSEAELAKAKNQALTGKVFGSLSTEQKASDLGEADLLYGTPAEVNKELDELAAVTQADIRRVARKYFAPEKRNIFTILPASMQTRPANTATGKEAK